MDETLGLDAIIQREGYVKAAQQIGYLHGEIQVDDDANIRLTKGGAYVQAWVFVSDFHRDEAHDNA